MLWPVAPTLLFRSKGTGSVHCLESKALYVFMHYIIRLITVLYGLLRTELFCHHWIYVVIFNLNDLTHNLYLTKCPELSHTPSRPPLLLLAWTAQVSGTPSGSLAWRLHHSGHRKFTIIFKNLQKKSPLPTTHIERMTPECPEEGSPEKCVGAGSNFRPGIVTWMQLKIRAWRAKFFLYTQSCQ